MAFRVMNRLVDRELLRGEIRVYHQDVYVLHGGEFRIKRVPVHAQFNFDTYIFDLDGTLISSLHDLAASCNYALKLNGMPERTLEEVRMFVGNGVKKLMERAVPGGLRMRSLRKPCRISASIIWCTIWIIRNLIRT